MSGFKGFFAAAALACLAAPASAEIVDDIWRGESASRPAQGPVQAYKAHRNHCPAGKRPVMGGDAIHCGVPNAAGYWHPEPRGMAHHARAYRKHHHGAGYEGWKGVRRD
ncbi:MAG: hypothetical protein ACLFQL_03795 [Paracoccaceae bacterium]